MPTIERSKGAAHFQNLARICSMTEAAISHRRFSHCQSRLSLLIRRLGGQLTRGVLGGAMLLGADAAVASETLTGNYLQFTLNDSGGIYTGPDTLRYDATGSGNFASPTKSWSPYYDAFGIHYGTTGGSARSVEDSLQGFNSNTGVALLAPGTGGFDHAGSWTGTINSVLDITNVYALNDSDRRIRVTTTVHALGNVDDVRFVHKFIAYANTSAEMQRGNATLGYATKDFVTSQSGGSGPTVAYFTDAAVDHNAGIVNYLDYDPNSYLNATTDQQNGIAAIGLGFDLGDLVNGQSITFGYWIAVGDDPNDFIFSVATDFASKAQTFNESAVATFLDSQAGNLPAEVQDIVDQLSALDDAHLLEAANRISGAVYGSLPNANFQHTSYYLSQLAARLRGRMVPYGSLLYGDGDIASSTADQSPAAAAKAREVGLVNFTENQGANESATDNPPGCDTNCGDGCSNCASMPCCGATPWTGWVTGYGLGGAAQSDGNADGFHYGIGGTQIGLECQGSDTTTVGFWGNFAWSNVRGDALDENADIENYHFGAHLTWLDDDAYWIAIGGGGVDNYDIRRQLNILAPVQAEGKMDGWQANAYLERGLTLCANDWNVQPYAALQYIYLRQGEVVETGAGALNLDVDDIDAHSLRGIVGSRLSKTVCTDGGRMLTPEIRAAWMHEFQDTNQLVNVGFAGIGGAGFAVRGVDLGRDWATVGTGFQLHFNESIRLFAGYDLQVNGNQTFHAGSGGVEFAW
jgi:outer membrane autotransporter protein